MTDKTCETCRFWDLANAVPGHKRLTMRYDDDFEKVIPPHANLNWSECSAAVEGFEVEDTEKPHIQMAVFDGSGYSACLYTRFDHFCAQHTERKG